MIRWTYAAAITPPLIARPRFPTPDTPLRHADFSLFALSRRFSPPFSLPICDAVIRRLPRFTPTPPQPPLMLFSLRCCRAFSAAIFFRDCRRHFRYLMPYFLLIRRRCHAASRRAAAAAACRRCAERRPVADIAASRRLPLTAMPHASQRRLFTMPHRSIRRAAATPGFRRRWPPAMSADRFTSRSAAAASRQPPRPAAGRHLPAAGSAYAAAASYVYCADYFRRTDGSGAALDAVYAGCAMRFFFRHAERRRRCFRRRDALADFRRCHAAFRQLQFAEAWFFRRCRFSPALCAMPRRAAAALFAASQRRRCRFSPCFSSPLRVCRAAAFAPRFRAATPSIDDYAIYHEIAGSPAFRRIVIDLIAGDASQPPPPKYGMPMPHLQSADSERQPLIIRRFPSEPGFAGRSDSRRHSRRHCHAEVCQR